MKLHKFFILGLVLIPLLSFSQKENNSKIPDSKVFMIELNFNPFGDEGVFRFDNLQTKYYD